MVKALIKLRHCLLVFVMSLFIEHAASRKGMGQCREQSSGEH